MPPAPARPLGQPPPPLWEPASTEPREPWRGAVACLGVAVFFALTIGVVSWQAAETPRRAWLLRGPAAGLAWERRAGALLLLRRGAGRPLAAVAPAAGAAAGLPPPLDRCRPDGSRFCGAWDEAAELHVSLEEEEEEAPGAAECYGLAWTPLRPGAVLKDCFSMANVSWYGGAGVRAPRWLLNDVDAEPQPFVISDFSRNPGGYGPVLEGYFLGSTGVTVMVAPDMPLFLSVESNRHFCLESPPGSPVPALRYRLCASADVAAAHRHAGSRLTLRPRRPPHAALLGLPIWQYHGPGGSATKIKRGLRAFSNRLQRHRLKEGLLALGERCTAALADTDQQSVLMEGRKRRSAKHAWDLSMIKPMKLSITLSPYTSIASPLFLRSLQNDTLSYWLSLRLHPEGSVPLLTHWKGQLSTRLNTTSEAAVSWFLARARHLQQVLGAEHAVLEGAEGNAYFEQGVQPPTELEGDHYAGALAAMAVALGNATIITAGARSSHLPLFVRMSPLRSDWSHAGLKGLIPAALHYSLLGYNFFLPDAVGGTLASELPVDQELYVRWLQIVTFLPVMSFSTPPWACCDAWVLNLTRQCIRRHRDFVAPLIIKYSQDWVAWGYPIFRPVWWLSPMDPAAFTIEDEFLIGDEVLVAPITEKGQTWRDIYLPGGGCLWMDTNTAQVFDGGTVLRNYSASLTEVPVFIKTS
ncbi:SITS-binding protein-like [Rhea pennata]|uniref:SITS-binding protein-like n=1 Tax=Rhea pennata TaxID=8795 RepID=UPI002E261CBB